MLEYTGGNPAAQSTPWINHVKTIAVLRIGAGLLLLWRHGWDAAWGASQFLWAEKEWSWVRLFGEAGFPQPHLTAPAAALVVILVGVSWTMGFLTRLFSLLFLPAVITFLVFVPKTGPHLEAACLYLLTTVTLLLHGSGALSIDGIFRLGAEFKTRAQQRKNRR